MKLPFDFDGPLFVPLALGLLALNVLSLAVLLALRPAVRRARGKSAGSRSPGIGRALLAEFLGTFAVVLVGMLVMIAGQPAPDRLVVALVNGGILAAMMAGVGRASGGHFNPAVSLGCVFASRLGVLAGTGYLFAQFAGAAVAAALLGGMFGPEALLAALPAPGAGIAPHAIVALEALACLLLIVVIFGSAVDLRATPGVAPFAVGLTTTLGMLAFGPLSGGVLNPVRFLAPAVMTMRLDHWVYYLAGPGIGCVLGAVLMQFFFIETPAEATTVELVTISETSESVAA